VSHTSGPEQVPVVMDCAIKRGCQFAVLRLGISARQHRTVLSPSFTLFVVTQTVPGRCVHRTRTAQMLNVAVVH